MRAVLRQHLRRVIHTTTALVALAAGAVRASAQDASAASADSGRIVAFVHWERGAAIVVGNRQSTAPAAVTRVPIANALLSTQEAKLELGRSRSDGYAVLTLLPAGRQRLVIAADGYRTLQCRVEVRAGVTDTLEVRLVPAQAVPGFNNNAYGCRQPR